MHFCENCEISALYWNSKFFYEFVAGSAWGECIMGYHVSPHVSTQKLLGGHEWNSARVLCRGRLSQSYC